MWISAIWINQKTAGDDEMIFEKHIWANLHAPDVSDYTGCESEESIDAQNDKAMLSSALLHMKARFMAMPLKTCIGMETARTHIKNIDADLLALGAK
jgi:hypothetical protein